MHRVVLPEALQVDASGCRWARRRGAMGANVEHDRGVKVHGQADANLHVHERGAEGFGHGVTAARAGGALIHGAAKIHEEGSRHGPDASNALLLAKSKQALEGAAIAVGIAAGGANARSELAEDKGLAVGGAGNLAKGMRASKHGRFVLGPRSGERGTEEHDRPILFGEVFGCLARGGRHGDGREGGGRRGVRACGGNVCCEGREGSSPDDRGVRAEVGVGSGGGL